AAAGTEATLARRSAPCRQSAGMPAGANPSDLPTVLPWGLLASHAERSFGGRCRHIDPRGWLLAMAVAESFQAESEPGSTQGLDHKAYIYLALMVLIGSSTATAAKFVVRELPVSLLPLVRFGGAGLCLLPIVWRGGTLARLLREDWPRL